MNIIRRELRANLKSLLIWSAVMIIFIVMMMAEFSAYYNNPEMAELIDAMPPAVQDAMAMSGVNLTTVSGFVSVAAAFYTIILGVHAVVLGSSLLTKEEQDKTAEFLLPLPVSRKRIVLEKNLAGIIQCLIINGVTVGTILIATARYDKTDHFSLFIWLMTVGMFILQMIFLHIGLLLASWMRRHKRAGRTGIGFLLGMYILSILISINDRLEPLAFITPFKYFEAADLLQKGQLNALYGALSLAIIAICIAGTYYYYQRRDIHL